MDTQMVQATLAGHKRLASAAVEENRPESFAGTPTQLFLAEFAKLGARFDAVEAKIENSDTNFRNFASSIRQSIEAACERLDTLETARRDATTALQQVNDDVSHVRDDLHLLQARMDEMEQERDQLRSSLEFLDRRARANQMIIQNVPEADTTKAQELLLNGSSSAAIGLLSFERMGAPKTSPTARPRPICARFASRTAKQAAWKRSASFREMGAALRDDLTPAQRATKAARASEVALLRAQGFTVSWRGTTLYKSRDGQPRELVPPSHLPPLGGRTSRAATRERPAPAARGARSTPAAHGVPTYAAAATPAVASPTPPTSRGTGPSHPSVPAAPQGPLLALPGPPITASSSSRVQNALA